TALRTGTVREDREVVAPLADLIALPAVGRDVRTRLPVDGRRLRGAPPHLASVLDARVVVVGPLDQRVEVVAAGGWSAQEALLDLVGRRPRSGVVERAAHGREVGPLQVLGAVGLAVVAGVLPRLGGV